MKVSIKRGGPYFFVSYSRGGSHIFSRIFLMRIFVCYFPFFFNRLSFFFSTSLFKFSVLL